MEREASRPRRIARALATRRLFAYAAGLAIVTFPRALASLGYSVPSALRTACLVLGLGLMVVTYASELWVGRSEESAAEDRAAEGRAAEPERRDVAPSDTARGEPTYSRRDRIVISLSALGVAAGVYIALNIDQVTGLLFILGAFLFGQYGFRKGRDGSGVSKR